MCVLLRQMKMHIPYGNTTMSIPMGALNPHAAQPLTIHSTPSFSGTVLRWIRKPHSCCIAPFHSWPWCNLGRFENFNFFFKGDRQRSVHAYAQCRQRVGELKWEKSVALLSLSSRFDNVLAMNGSFA